MDSLDENTNKIKQLEEEVKELKNFNRKLQTLNCTIAHEMKSSLHAINSYAGIFIEDYEKQIDENGAKLIRSICNLCSDTLSIMDNLLGYIKIQDIEPANEKINLDNLISEVFEKLVSVYEKDVKLNFETKLPDIFFDKVLIKLVITNLISNALKFSQNEEIPTITVGYKYDNEENVFYIRDNGVGFDMKFSEKLFEMFQRMHSSDEFEGNGLGLVIVKSIIEKYYGRVWIEGEVGRGACIYFTMADKYIIK